MEEREVKKISLLDLALTLLERKKLILITMTVVTIVSLVVSSLLTKYYTATAVVLPSTQSSPLAGALGSLSEGLPVGGLLQSLGKFGGIDNDQFLSILDSRRLADRVIAKYDLVHRYRFHKAKKWYYETLLKVYFRNLEVEETKLGNVSISFTDTSPAFAAEVTNYIVGQLDSITYEISKTSARNSRVFFDGRLQAIKQDLDSAHDRFNVFKIKHGYLDLDQQVTATVDALAGIEAQKMALDVQIDQLHSRFDEDNNKMRELIQSRSVLNQRIDRYMKNGGGRLIIALDSAPELGVRYAHLYRDVKVQETLYNMVLQMYEQAKFTEVNNTPVVRVLEYAQVPQKKRRPQRSVLCALWFSIGLILVASYVVGSKWYLVQRDSRTDVHKKITTIRRLLLKW